MKESHDKERLPERLEAAAYWGVQADPIFTKRLESTRQTLTNLKAGLDESRDREAIFKVEIESALSRVVDLIGFGGYPEPKDMSKLAQKVGAMQILNLLMSNLEDRIQQAEKDEILAASDLSNDLATRLNEKQGRQRQKYEAFLAGQGERSVSEETGRVKIRCGGCQRVIGTVDSAELKTPLTPGMFTDPGGYGQPVFTDNRMLCPACRGRAIFDENYVLTEKFEFLQVSSNRGGNSDTDGERIPK